MVKAFDYEGIGRLEGELGDDAAQRTLSLRHRPNVQALLLGPSLTLRFDDDWTLCAFFDGE